MVLSGVFKKLDFKNNEKKCGKITTKKIFVLKRQLLI
jgi:hypothetical protein